MVSPSLKYVFLFISTIPPSPEVSIYFTYCSFSISCVGSHMEPLNVRVSQGWVMEAGLFSVHNNSLKKFIRSMVLCSIKTCLLLIDIFNSNFSPKCLTHISKYLLAVSSWMSKRHLKLTVYHVQNRILIPPSSNCLSLSLPQFSEWLCPLFGFEDVS